MENNPNDKTETEEASVTEKGTEVTEKNNRDYDELKDRFLRLAAEFDNYKKRVANEIADSKELGKAELIKHLLKIMDEFDLTLIAAGKSNDKALLKGIELLYANFIDVLKKSGLKEIETKGKFDPYKHEIAMVRDGEKDDIIIEVIKKGYTLNDRLLRAASVIVSKETKKEELEREEGEGNETVEE